MLCYTIRMRIILFRHGERQGDNLTKVGKRNVKVMSKQLKEFHFKALYCSPATRCMQTTQILLKKLNLPDLQVREGLDERWQLKHAPTSKEEQAWWDNYMNLDYRSSTFETCHDFVTRNAKVFDEIKENFDDEDDILIVAHTATAYALLAYITKKSNGVIDWIKIGNCNYLTFELDKNQD